MIIALCDVKLDPLVYLFILIMLCGDIELNPGPIPSNDSFEFVSSPSTNSFSDASDVRGRNKLRFVHLNVRSLLPKIDQISVEFSEYDIIALTETFLDASIENDDINIPGYYPPFRKDRSRHGGGVCIYVKQTIFAQRYEFHQYDIEEIWLKIRTHNTSFFFACVYRPPNADNEFWYNFTVSVQHVKSQNDPKLYIVGDLNSNFLVDTTYKLYSQIH